MKRTLVGVLSTAFLASIIPLAGCDSGGDAGLPADTKPGVPLESMKADMSKFKKQDVKKEDAGAKTPGTPKAKD